MKYRVKNLRKGDLIIFTKVDSAEFAFILENHKDLKWAIKRKRSNLNVCEIRDYRLPEFIHIDRIYKTENI